MNKESIKKILGNKRWSVVCDRALNFIKDKNIKTLENIGIVTTQDMDFLNRNHTNRYYKNIIDGRNIGVKSYGGTYNTIYIVRYSN